MNVLIAGCGYVGLRAAVRLRTQGHRVFGLRRQPPADDGSIEWMRGDLTLQSLERDPPPVDLLILAAGLRRDTDDAYRRLFMDGYEWLIRSLTAVRPPKRIVMISTTGVFAESEGGFVDESSPVDDRRIPARYYLAAERLTTHAGVPSSVLRLSGIYGPGRTRLINEVREGRARLCAPPPHYLNHLHAEDAAGALVHVALMDRPAPLYVVSDTEPADRNDVLRWIAGRLGREAPPAAEVDERPARRSGNKRCRSGLLAASGYRFQFPTYREGYSALLQTGS